MTRLLDHLNVRYELIEIPLNPDRKPIRYVEELLSTQGGNPEQIIRSLLFRTGFGRFVRP